MAWFFVDNICGNYFPRLAIKVFPLVAAIVADTEACFEHVNVVCTENLIR